LRADVHARVRVCARVRMCTRAGSLGSLAQLQRARPRLEAARIDPDGEDVDFGARHALPHEHLRAPGAVRSA
jgi:hypothetical protein